MRTPAPTILMTTSAIPVLDFFCWVVATSVARVVVGGQALPNLIYLFREPPLYDAQVSDSDDLATFVDADIGNGGGADANEAGTLEPAFGPGSGGDADDAPGGDPGHAANLGRLRKAQRKKEREERRKLKLEARRKRERVRKTLSVTGVAPLSKKEVRLASSVLVLVCFFFFFFFFFYWGVPSMLRLRCAQPPSIVSTDDPRNNRAPFVARTHAR